MKRLGMILMACMLVLGMSQCKKENLITTESNSVKITLKFDNDSKAVVDPTGNGGQVSFAPVSFETGDRVYVGYNNAYVGYLDYANGSFSGTVNIENPDGEQHLHFYLLGGKGFTPVQDGNTFTVDISDQILKYPVISYATSREPYTGANSSYTAKLKNKCSIMKFNVTKTEGYETAGTCIKGMNNKVSVDFANPDGEDNGFTYGKVEDDGMITLAPNAGEVWGILLPQPAMDADAEGAFSGRWKGSRAALPKIEENKYLTNDGAGYNITVTTAFQPEGTLNGLFKVSDNKYVMFSKASLKATTTDRWNTWTWSFKDTQYEYEDKGEVGDNYANRTEVGLFGWATSGYNLRGNENNYYYKPNSTAEGSTGSYGPSSLGFENITGSYAKGDWGYNKITSNAYYQWRVLTKDEWEYLKANHTIGWVKIKGSGSTRWFGHAILPYGSTETLNSEYTIAQWEAMEANGAVLLPISGCRVKSGTNYTKISRVDDYGYYWSSTLYSNNGQSWYISNYWYRSTLEATDHQSRAYGCSVRLVCE